MITRRITYNFLANLQKNENLRDTEYWHFQVLANDSFEAEKMLLEYLSNPENTGIKYEECVGLRFLESGEIIVNE